MRTSLPTIECNVHIFRRNAPFSGITSTERMAIRKGLKSPDNYEKNSNAIFRIVSNSTDTTREIAHEADVLSVRHVLQTCGHLKQFKMKRESPLTKEHKEQRLQFARDRMK